MARHTGCSDASECVQSTRRQQAANLCPNEPQQCIPSCSVPTQFPAHAFCTSVCGRRAQVLPMWLTGGVACSSRKPGVPYSTVCDIHCQARHPTHTCMHSMRAQWRNDKACKDSITAQTASAETVPGMGRAAQTVCKFVHCHRLPGSTSVHHAPLPCWTAATKSTHWTACKSPQQSSQRCQHSPKRCRTCLGLQTHPAQHNPHHVRAACASPDLCLRLGMRIAMCLQIKQTSTTAGPNHCATSIA